ncbi:MAG: VCBS repeat-containing protein, partial [Candidatus Omnitrophica bacterium]|nr:VCBS repeat-containing protein [Candidatus Omnitrophota bacterium]
MLASIAQYGSDGLTSLPPVTLAYQDNEEPSYHVNDFNNVLSGDHRWNIRWDGGYDRGHDNYGPVPPSRFDVTWQGPSTAESGSNGDITWSVNGNGNLYFSANKDSAYWMWSYLYVDRAKTLSVPYSSGGVIGAWLNNNYSNVGKIWSLNAGYNLVEITAYHQHDGFTFNLNSPLADQVDLMSLNPASFPTILVGDFNGDGLTDKSHFDRPSGKVDVLLSSGTGFDSQQIWNSSFRPETELFTGDFNGDGKTDICSFKKSDGTWRVALSNGSQFIDDANWITGFGQDNKYGAGDFNADGLTDIVTFFLQSDSMYARIALNTGGGFQVYSAKDFVISNSGQEAVAVDFNGDGLTDLASYESDGLEWFIALNRGNLNLDFQQLNAVSNAGNNRNSLITDADSDGLLDIGYYDYSNGEVNVVLSEGMMFTRQKKLPFQFSLRSSSAKVQPADFNGDGLLDYFIHIPIGNTQIAFSSGDFPDLLSSVDNGVGGQRSIEYGPSTELNNTLLPFVIQTVKSVAVSNSLGDSYTTTHDYSGGLWNGAEREFRGFNTAAVKDVQGNYTQTE